MPVSSAPGCQMGEYFGLLEKALGFHLFPACEEASATRESSTELGGPGVPGEKSLGLGGGLQHLLHFPGPGAPGRGHSGRDVLETQIPLEPRRFPSPWVRFRAGGAPGGQSCAAAECWVTETLKNRLGEVAGCRGELREVLIRAPGEGGN